MMTCINSKGKSSIPTTVIIKNLLKTIDRIECMCRNFNQKSLDIIFKTISSHRVRRNVTPTESSYTKLVNYLMLSHSIVSNCKHDDTLADGQTDIAQTRAAYFFKKENLLKKSINQNHFKHSPALVKHVKAISFETHTIYLQALQRNVALKKETSIFFTLTTIIWFFQKTL